MQLNSEHIPAAVLSYWRVCATCKLLFLWYGGKDNAARNAHQYLQLLSRYFTCSRADGTHANNKGRNLAAVSCVCLTMSTTKLSFYAYAHCYGRSHGAHSAQPKIAFCGKCHLVELIVARRISGCRCRVGRFIYIEQPAT
jgi:hypothetical protein